MLSLTAKGGENSLLAHGVKVTYSAKAGKTGATKSASAAHQGHGKSKGGSPRSVSLPVADLELLGATTIRTTGALRLTVGKRRATLREVTIQNAGEQTAVSAKLGKRRLVFFRAQGAAEVGKSSATLSKAPLTLTGKGAEALGQGLGLGDLSAGRQGTISFNAILPLAEGPAPAGPKTEQPTPILDPYLAQCDLDVTEKLTGTVAAPAGAPTLSSPVDTTGGRIDWGFSGNFRYYVVEISGGALVPIAPAEVLNPPLPAPQIGSFRFPAGSGQYAIGTTADSSDDQVVIDGTGEVVLCNSPHNFRIVLFQPDGDARRRGFPTHGRRRHQHQRRLDADPAGRPGDTRSRCRRALLQRRREDGHLVGHPGRTDGGGLRSAAALRSTRPRSLRLRGG